MSKPSLKEDLERVAGLSQSMGTCVGVATFFVGLLLSMMFILPIKVMAYLSIAFAFGIGYSGSLFFGYRKEQKMVIDSVKRKMERFIAS